MKVTLIDYTASAATKLLFTKDTRLGFSAARWDEIAALPEAAREAELKAIANTIRSSHEFVNYTFSIEGVSRAFTHQFVRTRTGSYAQQSMRVTNMGEFSFVMPAAFERDAATSIIVRDLLTRLRMTYALLIEMGHQPEDARSILPTNIATNIVAQFNLRALADLLVSRLGGRTQDEYRRVAEGMLQCVLEVHPWAEWFIFRDFSRDYFAELEAAVDAVYQEGAMRLEQKGRILKIVDAMRGVK